MNCPTLSFALRDLRSHLVQPGTLVVMVGVALVMTLSGAFGTDSALSPVPRFGYWSLVIAGTYLVGALAALMAAHSLAKLPVWCRLVAMGLAAAVPVSVIVLSLNALVFGIPWTPASLTKQFPAFFAISMVVVVSGHVLDQALHRAGAAATGTQTSVPKPETPPILDRLPVDKRGGAWWRFRLKTITCVSRRRQERIWC